MAYKNLEEAIQASGNPVKMLRTTQNGADFSKHDAT